DGIRDFHVTGVQTCALPISLLLPVNTLLFRSEGLRVGVVKDGKVTLTAVTPGHDFGNQIEIVAGLKTDDQVIINPPDSLITGQQVQIVQATLPGDRSEEHTSELQSRENLVCRLLLEKKNKTN